MLVYQLLLAGAAFLVGSLPFSVWIGRYALGREITRFGDHNPGATNVLRAGSFPWFSLALMLDISKGAAPAGLAYHIWGWRGWPVVLIALAPALGHAFSPWLNWRGGKAIAATFGGWIGLTLWVYSLPVLLALIVWSLLITPSAWAVIAAELSLLALLLARRADGLFVAFWAAQMALMVWTHHDDLRRRPTRRRRR